MERRSPVVLLHGLGRSHRSFRAMQRTLEAAGFETVPIDYPSMRISLQGAAWRVAARVREAVGARPVSGVTHSLGGILARLAADRLEWDRLVMVAPPNTGCALMRALRRTPGLWLLGGRGGNGLADGRLWPAPRSPFAVIAGTRPGLLDMGHSLLGRALGAFDGAPHDGVITVEETMHAAMAAHARVEAGHYHILDHPETQALTLRFLESGRF